MRLTHKQNPQYLEKRVNLLALQLFGFDRLGDEVVAAMLEGLDDVLDVAEPGHKNNRRQRQAVAHLPAAFETVHHRHHRIHQHHVSRFKFSI
jgi:hypothetical protein